MGLFGKRQSDIDTVPQEVRDYYQSERRERSGMAWLLAIGTLVVTLVLAAGIFVGGRWAYRKVVNNDKPTPVATTQQQDNSSTDAPKTDDSAKQPASTTPTPSGSNTSNAPTSSPPTPATPPPTPSPAPVTTPATPATPTPGQGAGSPTSQAQTPKPAATTTPKALTNTGPGDMLVPFVLIVLFASITHNYLTTRKQTR